jgi:hypothetical protein
MTREWCKAPRRFNCRIIKSPFSTPKTADNVFLVYMDAKVQRLPVKGFRDFSLEMFPVFLELNFIHS